MDATLNLITNILAYGDVGTTSSPLRRFVDWSMSRNYPVRNPKTVPHTLAPGDTLTLFSGSRTTLIDGTTAFTLSLSALATDRYRFSNTGGTAPALRTDRALALNAIVLTLTAQPNQTLTMAAGAGTPFSAAQVGDTVFLPGPTTGDAVTVFSPMNEGYWTVLAVNGAGASLSLARLSGQAFVGSSETVTISSNLQVQAFSAAGVQVGDSVTISAGFSTVVQGTYTVVAVNPKWFEVITTKALPVSAVATPGATGLIFYTAAKRYIRVEADQDCVLRLNGDTGNTNTLSPWAPADPDHTATFEKVGPCWQAVVVNTSSASLNLLVITAE